VAGQASLSYSFGPPAARFEVLKGAVMVLVNHARKFIYMKTRKTAGTSIEMLLEAKVAPAGHVVSERTESLFFADTTVGARLLGNQAAKGDRTDSWREHMPARQVRAQIGRSLWDSYAIITSVRNPFDRAVSFFFWHRQWSGQDAIADFGLARPAFQAFLREPAFKNDRAVVHIKGVFYPQFAIRFEKMGEDLPRLGHQLGLDLSLAELPRTKDSTGKIPGRWVAEYFDAESRDLVLKKQSWVFDKFGYSTDPADASTPSGQSPSPLPKSAASLPQSPSEIAKIKVSS
jgi:hypothetical protein